MRILLGGTGREKQKEIQFEILIQFFSRFLITVIFVRCIWFLIYSVKINSSIEKATGSVRARSTN